MMWELGNMFDEEVRLTSFERLIDKATGFDKVKEKRANRLIKKVRKLIKEYKNA